MTTLESDYLGIPIKNPIVMASCGLTANVDGVRKAAEAGAGVVILKSLFEEQLRAELKNGNEARDAADMLEKAAIHGMAADYIDLVKKAKQTVDVPIIASVNCVREAWWSEFATQLVAAGADALELNIAQQGLNPKESSQEVEKKAVSIVSGVKKLVNLPLSVKIGSNYTNLGNLINAVADAGAAGVVLFNRFYKIDVDLASMSLVPGPARSRPEDFHECLRWIAGLFGQIRCSLIASGGVHTPENILKLVSVGASAVQICSAVYTDGYAAITTMVEGMKARMQQLNVQSVCVLRGHLSRFMSDNPQAYDRLQYIKALGGL